MKSKGYILFICYSKCDGFGNEKGNGIEIGEEYCRTKEDLMSQWQNHWDDKWDVEDRNKINYFYLDLSQMDYIALPRWKNPYRKTVGYNPDRETVMSKKIFNTEWAV